jgi:hypothetical protein
LLKTIDMLARRFTSAFLLGAALLTTAAAQAQQGSTAPAALTALDYFEIQQLNERYVHAIDNCIENGYEFASLSPAVEH